MAERPPFNEHDEVMDYLLGRLTPTARQQFEARLETDGRLRQEVREVEQGVVALALAAPPREAPAQAWENIEAAVTRQVWREAWFPFLRPGWLTPGWSVATLAVAALIGQWFWFRSSPPPPNVSAPAAMAVVVQHSATRPEPGLENRFTPAPAPAPVLPMVNSTPTLSAAQIAELRLKIAGLEAVVARLQSATQSPPAVMGSTAQGMQLLPPIGAPHGGTKTLSPQLQQAVLLAVAREMGWTLNPPAAEATHKGTAENPPVDFVDLRAPNAAVNPGSVATTDPNAADPAPPAWPAPPSTLPITTPVPTTQSANGGATEVSVAYNPSTGNDTANTRTPVAILNWGNKLIAAVDPATMPAASVAEVWSVNNNNGNPQHVGTVPLGNNPTVITVSDAVANPGQQYFISAGTNVYGQYPQVNYPPDEPR